MTDETLQHATYVYGIVRANHPLDVSGLEGVGDPPTRLRRLEAGQVAAIVGDAPPGLRAKRRDVLAHEHVLEELARQGTVLPMRFGIIARDEADLAEGITQDSAGHLDLLTELDGRVEFNVKAYSDEDTMIREVAASDLQVQQLRAHPATSMEDRVRLGEAVAAAIEERQESLGAQVLDTLEPLAVRGVTNPRVKGAAVNSSFLVGRDHTANFVEAVDKLGADLGTDVRLQLTGPLPPYSFVTAPGD